MKLPAYALAFIALISVTFAENRPFDAIASAAQGIYALHDSHMINPLNAIAPARVQAPGSFIEWIKRLVPSNRGVGRLSAVSEELQGILQQRLNLKAGHQVGVFYTLNQELDPEFTITARVPGGKAHQLAVVTVPVQRLLEHDIIV